MEMRIYRRSTLSRNFARLRSRVGDLVTLRFEHPVSTEAPINERRLFRWLLVCYCIFILYGSFIPFRFSTDADFIRLQWFHVSGREKFFLSLLLEGSLSYSLSLLDVISNFLLFVPFGFLWVRAKMDTPRVVQLPMAALVTGGVGFFFGLAIEVGQLFSLDRTSALSDAICNGLGAAGGTAAYFLLRGLQGRLGALLFRAVRERPSLVLLALLLVVPMASAFYPFEITLDVSTAWENLKRTQWAPFARGFHRFWLDLVIEKVVVCAAGAFLVLRNLSGITLGKRLAMAWAAVTLFAFFTEAGKLFFVGRVPNLENVILSSIGALCGVLLVPPISNLPPVKRRPVESLMVLSLALLAYSELSPFDWIRSVDELPTRVARIEWLPLASYYSTNPQSAVFDLGKKLFLVTPFGFLLAAKLSSRTSRCAWFAAVIGLLIGIVFEICQIALRTRVPSVTDALTFGIAAWIGAELYERYQAITGAEAGSGRISPPIEASAIPR